MKRLLVPALAASVLINFYALYTVLDRALLADDLGQTAELAYKGKSVLQKMLPRLLTGTTRVEVISAANDLQLELIEETGRGDCIDVVCFEYTDGRVTGFNMQF